MNNSSHIDGYPAGRRPRAFLPGEALAALTADILDPKACRRWTLERLHPDGPRCPHCGRPPRPTQQPAFWGLRRLDCPHCGRWYTALTGTMLHGCKLDIRKVFLIAACLALGLSTSATAAQAGVSTETVRLWRARFKALDQCMEGGQ